MQEISSEKRNTIEARLIRRKLRGLQEWQKPTIRRAPGPFDPSAFDAYESRISIVAAECEAFLKGLSSDEICGLPTDEPSFKKVRDEWRSLHRLEIQNLEQNEPEWSIGGLGHPSYLADFDYWISMERYTMHESLFLSVGLNPQKIDDHSFETIVKRKAVSNRTPAITYLVDRHEIFSRKFRYSIDAQGPVTPRFLLQWFSEVPIDVCEDFLEALKKRVHPPSAKAPNAETISLASQERQTALKLIAAMAVEQYGYKPDAVRSEVTSNIQSDLNSIGQNLDDKTIRKWLREASSLVDEALWKS